MGEKESPKKFSWGKELLQIIIFILAFSLAYNYFAPSEITEIKVYHAGSLTIPLEGIKANFESQNTVTILLEPDGSVTSVKKVTELGKQADLLAVADYNLIQSMMFPNYTNWYILFARNQMTLTYTNESRHADEITSDNWYEILQQPDVKWGFADPNQDPAGYRSLMVIQLAEQVYNDSSIFDELVSEYSAITSTYENGIYSIIASLEDFAPDTEKLVIRAKSVDLVSMLQSGGLDYAFEYTSIAEQHDLNYLNLSVSINLGDINFNDQYSKVKVVRLDGNSTGSPIVYGLTIPNNAPNPNLAEKLIAFILGNEGQQIFTANGQLPILPAFANDVELIPESLRGLVEGLE